MAVFEFTEEHGDLRAMVRGLLAQDCAEEDVRSVMESPDGFDRKLWDRLARELGLAGLVVPEEYGGAGAGMVEAAIVLEELGRALCPGPYLSTVIAELTLLSTGVNALTEPARELLRTLASGESVAAVAFAGSDGLWNGGDGVAEHVDGELRVSGEWCYVVDAHIADTLLLTASTPEGLVLATVDSDAPGVDITELESFDLTRRLSAVALEQAPARAIADLKPPQLADVLDLAWIAVAAEQSGTARATLDMAVAYAKERVQFGRTIGSFQAIKHLLADALLDVESAHSAAFYGAWAVADSGADLAEVAPLVKAWCSDTSLAAASLNMQVHGGLSFTWEHPAHLYYRRARSGQQLWGNSNVQRDQLADRIGLVKR